MTYKDIIDTLVNDSGDAGAAYRANAWRWLNLVRQDAASRGSWRSAKNSQSILTTDAGNTTGVYQLDGIDSVVGNEMYDITNHATIFHDTENKILRMETTPTSFGFPSLWADSGMTVSGERQIRLWPIPQAAYTIAYIGSKALLDVSSADENVAMDTYFGPLSSVGSMIQAGLRYYHDLNNNEDVAMVGRSQGTFYKLITTNAGQSGVDDSSSSRMEPVNRSGRVAPRGRFDPGHYGNR